MLDDVGMEVVMIWRNGSISTGRDVYVGHRNVRRELEGMQDWMDGMQQRLGATLQDIRLDISRMNRTVQDRLDGMENSLQRPIQRDENRVKLLNSTIPSLRVEQRNQSLESEWFGHWQHYPIRQAPEGRCFFSAHVYDNTLYVSGGGLVPTTGTLGNTWSLDMTGGNRWVAYSLTQPLTNNAKGLYAFVSVLNGSTITVWGGSNGVVYLDLMYQLDIVPSMNWKVVGQNNNQPSARIFSSGAVYSSHLFIYGGKTDPTNGEVGDFYIVDLRKAEPMPWQEITVSGGHSAIKSHSMTTFGSDLYVFGGSSSSTFTNALLRMDMNQNPAIVPWTWELVNAYNPPSPRDSHSACMHGNILWVFGGYAGSPTDYYNDLYSLDMSAQELRWQKQSTDTPMPMRSAAASLLAHQNSLYLFGGKDNSQAFSFLYKMDVGG